MRIVFFVAALGVSSASIAQDAPMRPMLSDGCRTEMQALCPATGDRDARRQCMMANRDKISAPCKAELMKMRAARQSMRGNGDMAAPGAMSTEPQNESSPQ
jgi:hypothetical protein